MADLRVGRSDRFLAALDAIDTANAADPEVLVVDGVEVPKELTHAEMTCAWVLRLDPGADELQLLAARAHHLRRWELPRSSYPEGRAGYLRWRTEQKKRHAAGVAALLEPLGFGADEIERVGAIIRKEGLRTDPVVQTHEDALCLVFLQTQFDALIAQLGEDHTVEVVAKTIPKMSGQALALVGELGLGPEAAAVVGRALAQVDSRGA